LGDRAGQRLGRAAVLEEPSRGVLAIRRAIAGKALLARRIIRSASRFRETDQSAAAVSPRFGACACQGASARSEPVWA